MSITFEDEEGIRFSPLMAAELASADRQTREYLSASLSPQTDGEQGVEEDISLTPLKSAAIARELKGKTRSASAENGRKPSFEEWCRADLECQLRQQN
jgi:hypothetical protein